MQPLDLDFSLKKHPMLVSNVYWSFLFYYNILPRGYAADGKGELCAGDNDLTLNLLLSTIAYNPYGFFFWGGGGELYRSHLVDRYRYVRRSVVFRVGARSQ